MAQPKPLSGLRAHPEPHPLDDHRRRQSGTGKVQVSARMDWLKTDLLATASLSPAEARALAIELLQAAEIAGRTP